MDELKVLVREKYSAIAETAESDCGCACGCDGINMIGDAYDGAEGYVAEADLGLGCGLPVPFAGLRPGHTVLDLGSGAGLDAFIARHEVGETGHVIGLDFTPAMLERARRNAEMQGFDNVSFVEGDIEAIPLPDAHVDVVVSNCVLNLVPNKPQAFREMHRVLRPGGHFCVSDVVSEGDLPPALREVAELYAGCVSGAIAKETYLQGLADAGFERVSVKAEREILLPEEVLATLSPDLQEASRHARLLSVTVVGFVPEA